MSYLSIGIPSFSASSLAFPEGRTLYAIIIALEACAKFTSLSVTAPDALYIETNLILSLCILFRASL